MRKPCALVVVCLACTAEEGAAGSPAGNTCEITETELAPSETSPGGFSADDVLFEQDTSQSVNLQWTDSTLVEVLVPDGPGTVLLTSPAEVRWRDSVPLAGCTNDPECALSCISGLQFTLDVTLLFSGGELEFQAQASSRSIDRVDLSGSQILDPAETAWVQAPAGGEAQLVHTWEVAAGGVVGTTEVRVGEAAGLQSAALLSVFPAD